MTHMRVPVRRILDDPDSRAEPHRDYRASP
jgi:hypothetical protein